MNKEKLLKLLNKDDLGYKISRTDVDAIVDVDFIKGLRKKLDVTQIVFASIVGVSLKTIEKWEQDKIKPRLMAKKLLYLIDQHPEILTTIYNRPRNVVYRKENIFVYTQQTTYLQNEYKINSGSRSVFGKLDSEHFSLVKSN